MKFFAGILTGILVAIIYTKNLHEDVWQEITLAYAKMQPVVSAPVEKDPVEKSLVDSPVSSQTEISPLSPEARDLDLDLDHGQAAEPEIPETSTPSSDGFQLAWTPFKSETSASGFANKLSRQLGFEFQVLKKGPRLYEVGFHYTSGRER